MSHSSRAQPPAWSLVAAEQIATVGLRIRRIGLLFGATCLGFVGVGVIVGMRARSVEGAYGQRQISNFTFTPSTATPLLVLAVFIALSMWEGEGPSRRSYHTSMPLSRQHQNLTRVFGGWCWLMIFTAVYLLTTVLVVWIVESVSGLPQPYARTFVAWEWLVPFTGVTIAYLLASALAVRTEQPFLWLFGICAVYFGIVTAFHTLDYEQVADYLLIIVNGRYGASAAMAGAVEWGVGNLSKPDVARWLGSTVLWGGASFLALIGVSSRRIESN
jgi:hypothetical protein